MAVAQKQKPKQKRRPSAPPSAAASEPTGDEAAVVAKDPEPHAPKRAAKAPSRPPAKDWLKMGIAVAVIVTLGLIALYLSGKT